MSISIKKSYKNKLTLSGFRLHSYRFGVIRLNGELSMFLVVKNIGT